VVKTNAAFLLLVLALGGCARTPDHSEYFGDPPSPEKTLEQTLAASEKGPSQWSPACTLPFYPVLLVADTTIKFVTATYRWVRNLFGGADEAPAVPERLERQAEKIQKN
jgi:hypothetical protein